MVDLARLWDARDEALVEWRAAVQQATAPADVVPYQRLWDLLNEAVWVAQRITPQDLAARYRDGH